MTLPQIVTPEYLAAIAPANGSKYSRQIYEFLRQCSAWEKQHVHIFRFEGTRLPRGLYFGCAQDGCFSYGCRIDAVVANRRCLEGQVFERCPGEFTPCDEMWQLYLERGLCAFDPDHRRQFDGQGERWEENRDERRCIWCGECVQHRARWTELVQRDAWSSRLVHVTTLGADRSIVLPRELIEDVSAGRKKPAADPVETRHDLDANAVIKRYLMGVSIDDLAIEFGVWAASIRKLIPDELIRPVAHAEVSNAEIRERYEQGATLAEVAAAVGMGQTAVWKRLDKMGVARRSRGSSIPDVVSDHDRTIKERYLAGETVARIGASLGFSGKAVRRRLGVMKVPIRSPKERGALRGPSRKPLTERDDINQLVRMSLASRQGEQS